MPKTVTGSSRYYGNGVTAGAEKLKKVVFEEGMEKIPDYFCSNRAENRVLTDIQIPESVNEIGKYAFYNCTVITIYGFSESYAETYAKSNGIPFKISGDKNTSTDKIDISKAKISGIQKAYEYTGDAIKPVPKVTLNNKQLTANKDYDISYKNNKSVGNAIITITGKGKYSGSQNIEFVITTIEWNIENSAVSFADVTWIDAKNKSYSAHIVANSKTEDMKKALASYCAVLAHLNKDVWKDFLTKYITEGWKLAGLNSVKKLDNKTVSKFFDRSEKLILVISGDQKAKKTFINDAGKTLKGELQKMTKTQFRNFIKNNVPNGDKFITAADQYKKVVDKYNDYKIKIAKWEKTRKASDLTKSEKAYQECQMLLESLNDSLSKIS